MECLVELLETVPAHLYVVPMAAFFLVPNSNFRGNERTPVNRSAVFLDMSCFEENATTAKTQRCVGTV